MAANMRADAAGSQALSFLTPAISELVRHNSTYVPYYLPTAAIFPGAVFLLLCAVVLPRWRRPDSPKGRSPLWWFLGLEIGGLVLLNLGLCVYRFYNLNRIPNDNYGELVFTVMSTSDLTSVLKLNAGTALGAAWAPLGLVYFLWMAPFWRISGATILTMRFAPAVASVLLTNLIYWLVRKPGGPVAGFLAAVFFSASPVEMIWARHDMFPFSQPSIVVVLLALATYMATTRSSVLDWCWTAILMGVSAHLFGSGRAAFVIPIGVFLWMLLFDRERIVRNGWKQLFLAVGLALWWLGPSIATLLGGVWKYVSPADPRLSSRAFRGGGWDGSLDAVMINFQQTYQRLFVGHGVDVHQTPLGLFGHEPGTFLQPTVVLLATVGVVWCFVARRRPESGLWLSFIAAGLIPGIISYAEAHREAVFFPAVCCLAGYTAGRGIRGLQQVSDSAGSFLKLAVVVFVAPVMFLRAGSFYFARPEGIPPDQTVAKKILELVQPDTLLIYDLPLSNCESNNRFLNQLDL